MESSAVERAIVAFERDAAGDWVARLACGHGHHVRHDPPWMSRPWVTTPEGRAGRIGQGLPCVRCAEADAGKTEHDSPGT